MEILPEFIEITGILGISGNFAMIGINSEIETCCTQNF